MSSIRMEHVKKAFGEHFALKDFSMDIQKGECVSVIGGSGSGKTTVLKLINGLVKADSGAIFVNDRNIDTIDQNELRRQIGYVIQSIALFPHMNIEDNIGYVLRLKKTPKINIEKRVRELMIMMELDKSCLHRYPDELSGGQRQRVGIARALACAPDILLMDEPFGAVDEIVRRSLQNEVIKIHKQLEITIFFITHDIKEALRLGDRMMVMKDGRIEQFDSVKVVQEHPKTAFVKELLSYLEV